MLLERVSMAPRESVASLFLPLQFHPSHDSREEPQAVRARAIPLAGVPLHGLNSAAAFSFECMRPGEA